MNFRRFDAHHQILGLATVAAALLASGPAAAAVGVGVRLGSQGVGAEVAVGVTKWLSIRGGYYGGSIDKTVDEGGIDYDATLRVGGVGVLADFFPMRGGFHLTAGLFQNDNEIEVEATPTEAQEIGGVTYEPSEIGKLSGRVEFDDKAPYFGIGWGNLARGKRVGFLFDLGVLRQGSGDVKLRSTREVSNADLRAEEREIEDDISSYDLWPVIAAGLAIRF